MNEMNITSAQYNSYMGVQDDKTIVVVIDGETILVPAITGNRHYDEIMRQQSEGLLTIADAD